VNAVLLNFTFIKVSWKMYHVYHKILQHKCF